MVHSGPTHGDFYRPLAPGKYTVVVRREGFSPSRANITVPASGAGVVRDFVLRQKRVSPAAAGTTTPSGMKMMVESLSPAEQQRDNLLLLGAGVLVLYMLWLVHRQMVHRIFGGTRRSA